MPNTLRQSGRFAVISKSITASSSVLDAAGRRLDRRHLEAGEVEVGRPAARAQPARPRSREARKRGSSNGKLLQEAQVVLVELADVVHAEHQHGDALDADAEGEARDRSGS
jgi:hypothetical protein